ncbi:MULTISPECIES: hypothetical protein [unclassified Moorena]|uniref:hypothetical protein n=2 Tax=Coleofasciculaceae TaxID=1892251 RepID=UPI0013C9CBA5|nr:MULTISPECIES: hypothetical protein [unclassified Moorena]NEO20305.1 hypothetical protein [Moorena sp. SIO4A5]
MIYPVTGNPQLMALGAKIDLGQKATLREWSRYGIFLWNRFANANLSRRHSLIGVCVEIVIIFDAIFSTPDSLLPTPFAIHRFNLAGCYQSGISHFSLALPKVS